MASRDTLDQIRKRLDNVAAAVDKKRATSSAPTAPLAATTAAKQKQNAAYEEELSRRRAATAWDNDLAARHGLDEETPTGKDRLAESRQQQQTRAYRDALERQQRGALTWNKIQSSLPLGQYSAAVERQIRDLRVDPTTGRLTNPNNERATNAREKLRRENAMRDYRAMQADKNGPMSVEEMANAHNPFDPANLETGRSYNARKTLFNDIPKENVLKEYESRYGVTGNPRVTAMNYTKAPVSRWTGRTKTTGEAYANAVADVISGKYMTDPDDPEIDQRDLAIHLHAAKMTDAEKNTVLTMAINGKLDELDKYIEALTPTLNERSMNDYQENLRNTNRMEDALSTAMQPYYAPAAYLQTVIDQGAGRFTDVNAGAVGALRASQMAREHSLDNASPLGQLAGQTAYNAWDNIILRPLGLASPNASLIPMALGAAGQTATNVLEDGGSLNQANMEGLVDGIIEHATEQLDFDRWLKVYESDGVRGGWGVLKTMLLQQIPEIPEEVLGEIASGYSDYKIRGNESEYSKMVRDAEADGVSHDKAVRDAKLEFLVKRPLKAGLMAFFSAAPGAALSTAVNAGRTARADRAAGQQITNRENVGGSFEDVVLAEGMKSSDKRIASKAAALDAIRHENRRSEGFKWSNADQRAIGEIYDSLDADAKARVEREASNRRAEAEAQARQEIETRLDAAEAKADEEQRKQTIAEQEAETDRLVAEAEGIDLDSADVLAEEEPAEQPETRAQSARTEAEEMDRLASIADEATRTGDTSVLDKALNMQYNKPRGDTDGTAEGANTRRDQSGNTGVYEERSGISGNGQGVSGTGNVRGGNSGLSGVISLNTRRALDNKGATNAHLTSSDDNYQAFSEALQTAIDTNKNGKAVSPKTVDELRQSGAKTFLSDDNMAGVLVTRDGDVEAVFKNPQSSYRKVSDDLIVTAIENGGTKLDCYGKGLARMYAAYGFTPVAVVDYNAEYDPGLPASLHNPDVYVMMHNGDSAQTVAEKLGTYPEPDFSNLKRFGPDDYEAALAYRDELLSKQQNAQQMERLAGIAEEATQTGNTAVLDRAQQQAAQPAQQTQEAQPKQAAPTTSPDEAGRQTANNARKAGLSAEDTLALSNVARQLGVNLEFRKMRIENINGAYNRETNTILLNQNLSTAEMAWTVFAHEITHAAETAGAYEQVRDIAKRHAAQFVAEGQAEEAWSATIDELRRDYAKNGVKLDRRGGEFEAVANIMQEILGSRESMEGVAQYSREDAQALLASINNVLDRVTENGTAVTPESARFVQAQKALAAALSEVRAQNRYKEDFSANDAASAGKVQTSVAGVNMDDVIRRAIERYGLMPAGEQLVDENGNPVTRKNTEVPNKASANTRSRSFYRTAAESNNVAIDVKTRALLDQYIPTSNEKNVKAGKAKRAEYSNFDQAYGAWKELMRKGRFSSGKMSEDIAFGEQLLLEAQKVGDGEAAINILTDIAMFGTEGGQAIQAISILKRLSPEGQLMNYKRVAQVYAQKVQKQGGKVPADVQTAMDTIEVNEDLLNKLEELERLKKLEANGDKMTESEAQKIADLEEEIEKLNEKLKPMLDKLAKLKAERHEDAMEAGKLKRQEKTLPRQIEATQKEIDEIQKVIDELNEKLEPKRIELKNKLAEESLAKEQRDKLRKELSEVNEDIRKARDKINRARASILHAMAEMSVKKMKLQDMQQYIKALRTSKEIINIYLRYVQNKGGGVIIPSDLQTAFLNAKTDEERDRVRKQMDIAIADQLPGTWSEKIRGWRYISMLFNPTTHERNILGNVTQYGLKGMRDTIATGMERIFIKPGEERTKAIASRISKADRAYFDAAQADYKIIEDDLQAGGRESETAGIDKARKIYNSKVLEAMRRFSGGLLESEDKVFLRANYTQSYAEYLKANKIDPANMTDEQKTRARQIAFQQALEATYRDASTLATWMSNLEKQGAGWEFAMGGIMPFKKTPINVLKRGVEYSPAGLIKATYDMVQATRGRNTKTKADIIGEYASGITGTMLSALGLVLARAGMAFATPSDDDKDRKAAIDKETGMQNYAIKFKIRGKEWTYTFDWLAPASMAFFAGVRSFEAFRNKEKMCLQGMLDGLISTVNPVFELSMLDGLADMFRSYASSGSGAAASVMWSILESYALQFFPTFGSKLARVIDPFQRSTYTAKDAFPTKDLQRLYRRILAKIPGATYALEPVTDSHGDLKANIGGNILGRIAYNFASPGYLKEVTHNEIDEESKRVYADTGETEALPKEVPTSVNMNGETYYLDAHEYRLWGERMGKEAAAGIDALIQTDAYKNANAVQQSKMIADIRKEAYENAKIAYFEDIGIADEYYTKGAQSNIEKLLYDDSQGYREYKNIPAVRELYESGVLDPKTVYDAALTLSHIKKDADKLDALNNMEGLNQDEYSFLYMTKIADDNMMADIQATLDAGGDLYKAVSVASQYYKWDESAVDEKTGETGKWVSVDKGTKAGLLADSDLTNSAKEAFYLNKIVSTNNVEKEQAKIAEYYDRGLTINDYLHTLGIKYDDEGTAYENSGGLYRELLASGYSDAVKDAAVCNIIKHTENSSDKAEADISVYKAAKLTVNDYLAANAAMYGSDGNALKTVREKAIGLRDSGMSDKAKTVAWYTTVSDAKAAEENIRTFLSGGNTVDQFLTAVSATSVDGMKQYQKAAAIMQMGLKSYTAAMKSVVTGSENAAEAINNSLAHGISDKLVATAYTEYLRINADESTYGNAKAQQFAKWLEEDSRMSTLSRDQRNFMRDNFSYYIQIKASAGTYNNLMSYTGMSSKAADSISTALSSLKPLPGAKGVSTVQKYTAIANDRNSTDNEKDIAMYNLLDTDDDEADSKALKYYKLARSHGVSVAQYADFRTKNATLTADKDKNGKSISGSKREKQLKLINSYPISAAAKDDLYRAAGLGESTIKKAPWH